MTVTVTHTKVSAIPDGADTTVVRPSDWNASHTLVGLGTAAELDAGVANGVATLDSSGKVPSSQLTGVVTSVAATVPSFLSVSGSPITSSGTLAITYSGVALPIANGGTNATTANSGFNNLAPNQTANSGKYLTTDGTNTSWASVASTPAGSNTQVQFNNSGAFGAAATFTWNGTSLSVPALAATTSVTTPLVQSSASNLALTASTGIVDASGNTGALTLAIGTTAQRPASPVTGMTRYNTSLGLPEFYNGTNWIVFGAGTYTASYLIVAGGGGGGTGSGGGGGAGGVVTGTVALTSGTSYVVTVGSGGVAGDPATQGSNSSITGLTAAVGGGKAGSRSVGANNNGGSGGSGGGVGYSTSATAGTATATQGNAGGTTAATDAGGGGGGAGAVGSNGAGGSGGAGGVGVANSITGSSVFYAGGGGAGQYNGTGGAGGNGGGASGTGATLVAPAAATANTGGGGGGGGGTLGAGCAGSNGGSGVVIFSIPTANYTGITTGSPTVTTSGANTILKYTASGTYTA